MIWNDGLYQMWETSISKDIIKVQLEAQYKVNQEIKL